MLFLTKSCKIAEDDVSLRNLYVNYKDLHVDNIIII